MIIHEFKTANTHPNSIINTIFVYQKHSYRIVDLIKTWGEPPVLLGYIKLQDEEGNFKETLIKCRKNFKEPTWTIYVVIDI